MIRLTQAEAVVQELMMVIPVVMSTVASELRRTGYALAPPHFHLLMMLVEAPRNLSELAGEAAVSLPTMSNCVTTLVRRGWVQRGRDPRDRRMVLIELTPTGRTALYQIRREAEARVMELVRPLSPPECEQLLAGLSILRAAFSRAGGQACPHSGSQFVGD